MKKFVNQRKLNSIYKNTKSEEDIVAKLNKKRKRRNRILNSIICITIALCLMFIAYLFLPVSKVKNVYIVNNNVIPEDELLKLSGINVNKSLTLFTYNFLIKHRVYKNKFVNFISIKKNLFGNYHIHIEEKQIVFKAKVNDNWVAFFADGTKENIPENYKITTTILDTSENNYVRMEELAKKLGCVPKEITEQISDIKYIPNEISEDRFLFLMKDHNRVVILMQNIDEKLKYYTKLTQYTKEEKYEFIMEYTKKGIIARKI